MTVKDILVLSMVKGLGPATIKKKMARLNTDIGSLSLIEELKPEELESVPFYEKEADDIISICHREQINIVDITSKYYPSSLLEISNPPTVLYVKGNMGLLEKCIIAIIGTRHSTNLGDRIAEKLGQYFSQNYSICNGLVEGIDEHSIYVNGEIVPHVIGVISGGLCYNETCSKNHIRVIEDVLRSNGLIISEFPPLKREDKFSGSKASRIQAGLSSGIILVQSKIDGGSKYTLDKFVRLGRVVGVVNFAENQEFINEPFAANRLIIEGKENGLARFVGLKSVKGLNVKAIVPLSCKDDYKVFEDNLRKPSDQLLLF